MMTGKRENSFVRGDSALGDRANRERQEHQAATNLSDGTDSSRGTVTGTPQNWVTGTFADRDSAERAYNLMLSRGYSEREINLMMSDETRKRYFSDKKATDSELGNKALESAGVGGAIGVTAGAILASVVASQYRNPRTRPLHCRADCGGARRGGRGRTDRWDHWRVDRLGHSRRAGKALRIRPEKWRHRPGRHPAQQ